ncbi:unnamed protein product [Bursaphelenchus xylophilus]|uniref:(pine wood nematode) hypothetical protein n=1 Tax=Bursaphelenchus xylophilus TaxID=6326 RepID=A0A1I7SG05_BURXY|nr:unnamed protein product [Bursaphelenchus xylophilus]CAG9112921.1 unnamed protein product [Bursaphelenchus xylophilus]
MFVANDMHFFPVTVSFPPFLYVPCHHVDPANTLGSSTPTCVFPLVSIFPPFWRFFRRRFSVLRPPANWTLDLYVCLLSSTSSSSVIRFWCHFFNFIPTRYGLPQPTMSSAITRMPSDPVSDDLILKYGDVLIQQGCLAGFHLGTPSNWSWLSTAMNTLRSVDALCTRFRRRLLPAFLAAPSSHYVYLHAVYSDQFKLRFRNVDAGNYPNVRHYLELCGLNIPMVPRLVLPVAVLSFVFNSAIDGWLQTSPSVRSPVLVYPNLSPGRSALNSSTHRSDRPLTQATDRPPAAFIPPSAHSGSIPSARQSVSGQLKRHSTVVSARPHSGVKKNLTKRSARGMPSTVVSPPRACDIPTSTDPVLFTLDTLVAGTLVKLIDAVVDSVDGPSSAPILPCGTACQSPSTPNSLYDDSFDSIDFNSIFSGSGCLASQPGPSNVVVHDHSWGQ